MSTSFVAVAAFRVPRDAVAMTMDTISLQLLYQQTQAKRGYPSENDGCSCHRQPKQ
jgi:hypothetical protein